MNHAKQLFPIALQELIAIGEKARKQREQRERAKQASKASFTRACKHATRKEKQAKQLQLQLQTRI
tara:strand:+ start:985 stop:1182 length:198 start_codon:yes stop_codon:yes gene_type:complete